MAPTPRTRLRLGHSGARVHDVTSTALGPAELLHRLRSRSAVSPVTHVERVPARSGTLAPWPSWAAADLVAACRRQGIEAPWQHQAAAASLAHDGTNVVLATGTAS